jgi:hypothetical protein
MCLCGAKPALRLHKHLRTAGARNPSLLRRKHYRDNDRAATVRYERESGDESARRSTSKPSAPRAAALRRPRGRQKKLAASAPREGSFALISCSLDEARDMHEQYEPRDCVSCMRVPRLVSGRRVPHAVPSSCMCLTYVNMHSLKPPHPVRASPHARFARLPHLHVNPPTPCRHLHGASLPRRWARRAQE